MDSKKNLFLEIHFDKFYLPVFKELLTKFISFSIFVTDSNNMTHEPQKRLKIFSLFFLKNSEIFRKYMIINKLKIFH